MSPHDRATSLASAYKVCY